MSEPVPQYSVRRTLAIWLAAAAPMGVLGWIVNPAIAGRVDGAAGIPGTARIALMTVGLAWQCLLTLLLVRREAGSLGWSVLRERLWLGGPVNPATGRLDRRLWLWVPVYVGLFVVSVFAVAPAIDGAWVTLFPWLAEPPEFSLAQLVAPGNRALVGAWWLYALFLALALFNTVLGEELLFRGLLLPRMRGAFGRWDWVANGFLFGVYHVHQPWGMVTSVIDGIFLFALPSARYRTAWMGIAVHSAQSVFFALVLLPSFLG